MDLQTLPSMKREITLGQMLSVAATLIIALATGWMTLNDKVSQHEVEIKVLQDRQSKTEATLDRIESKIELILIKLENKKDR